MSDLLNGNGMFESDNDGIAVCAIFTLWRSLKLDN